MRPVRFIIICLCLLYVGVSQASARAAAQQVSSLRPLWQLDIRRNEPVKDFLGERVVSDEARVFYLQGGEVRAVDAATGRQLWTYRIGKWAQLKYSSGWLLAVTYGGRVVALEPRTGRVRWQKTYRAPEGIETFTVQGDLLLVVVGERFIAYETATGRERWRVRGLYGLTRDPHHAVPSVSGSVVFLELGYHSLTSSSDLFAFDRATGKRLWKAFSHFTPLIVAGNKVYSLRDDYPMNLDYPGRSKVSIFDLRSGKQLGNRTYSVQTRATSYTNSEIAIGSDAIYVSGSGNLACFPLAAPGGKAKPDFIRVPRSDVQWLAGPHNGTFLLEWQGVLWLAQQHRRPCTPIDLVNQGLSLGKGSLTRADRIGNRLYISLRNGTFYGVNLQTNRVSLKLTLQNGAFGPTHVIGGTLVVQARNELLAYSLPEALKP